MCDSATDKKKGGLTLKVSQKKNKEIEIDSIIDLEKGEDLEIDSQSSIVKDIKKNASGADGPSW